MEQIFKLSKTTGMSLERDSRVPRLSIRSHIEGYPSIEIRVTPSEGRTIANAILLLVKEIEEIEEEKRKESED